jgi:hypothetical protein
MVVKFPPTRAIGTSTHSAKIKEKMQKTTVTATWSRITSEQLSKTQALEKRVSNDVTSLMLYTDAVNVVVVLDMSHMDP